MTYVVLPFQMYALTRSVLTVGLIGVIEFAPMVAMALIGGALADHFDRRRLIGFVESAMTLCCAVLAWNASLLAPHVVVLWIIAGLLAGLGALVGRDGINFQRARPSHFFPPVVCTAHHGLR